MNSRFAVIDFETTGLSPVNGDRITEVAVVIVESNQVVDQYQSLVNTGISIPYHIQRLTGITDQMVSCAPSAEKVITKLNKGSLIQATYTRLQNNAAGYMFSGFRGIITKNYIF